MTGYNMSMMLEYKTRSFISAVILLIIAAGGPAPVRCSSLPLFDPPTCHNMCTSQTECPDRAACLPVSSSARCGICVCTIGYRPKGDQCVPMGDDSSSNGDSRPVLRQPAEASTPAATQPTRQSSGQPAILGEWRCDVVPDQCKMKNIAPPPAADDDPMILRSAIVPEECKNYTSFRSGSVCNPRMHGGNECAGGGECVALQQADGGGSYCMCPPNKFGTSCHSEKPNLCESTTGEVPSQLAVDKRYRHSRLPHVGSVVARHWADSLNDCVRLCQWTGGLTRYPRCRSVNFGPINGRSACELISVEAAESSALHSWLVDVPGWTYACCFSRSIE